VQLKLVDYSEMNSRQKENYNFQKVSAVLADYGFVTLRLTDDWQGADFIAQHIDGERFLKVQLKGRLTFCKKYVGKDLYIAFYETGEWYLLPHDEVLAVVIESSTMADSKSWADVGEYSFSRLSKNMRILLQPYRIFPNPEAETANNAIEPTLVPRAAHG
jgi:hypothetical protein